MAKTKKNEPQGKTFEDRLERLEELGEEIRRGDISLDEALKAFEEGIGLARTLEKDLEKIESRIEILMNDSSSDDEDEEGGIPSRPELGLFDEDD
ncbi:MAG: exodeoxyribonuclease VII small subunit [Treponema sp.]|nr:exodeoxyribonuclease VII small subunit [Treponema sp.]